MEGKIIKFNLIYYNRCEAVDINGALFKLKEKENAYQFPNDELEMLELVNENNKLKNINDLYIIKFNHIDNYSFYRIYFKYKDVKFYILVEEYGTMNIKINIIENKWFEITPYLLKKLKKDKTFHNKIKTIVNDLKNELMTNTKERIHFLLNKERS